MSERLFENLGPAGIAFAAGRLGSEVSDPEDAARNLRSLRNGDKTLDDTDDDTLEEFPKEGEETDDDTLEEFPEEPISQPNSASPLEEDLPFGDDCGHNLDDCVVAFDSSSTRASMPANLEPTVLAEAPDGEQTEKERNAKKFSELCAGLGEGGSSKALYQVTTKQFLPNLRFVVPAGELKIDDGDWAEVVLMRGGTEIRDSSALKPNIGFTRGFEARVRRVESPDAEDELQVEFPELTFGTKKPIMQCAIGDNGKLFRKGKPGFDPKKTPTDPNMDFPFWIRVRTKGTRIEFPMRQQWRFDLVTTLDHVDNEEYLEWRKEQTKDHNTAEKARMAKSGKSEKRAKSSSKQATEQPPKKRAKSSRKQEVTPKKDMLFDSTRDELVAYRLTTQHDWNLTYCSATQSDRDLVGVLELNSPAYRVPTPYGWKTYSIVAQPDQTKM